MNKFYVTTASDYTNDVIHIGHAYQKILADALARYHRLLGDDTHFLTGTDENGQKVEKSARDKGIDPKKFVDDIAAQDKAEWDSLNISYDRFFRSTDADHFEFAPKVYLKAKEAGDIYKGKYEGYYCEGCESYYDESDLVGKKCPFHPNKEVQFLSEENYFFRLSKYQDFLIKHIETHPEFVWPEKHRNEVLAFIKRGLKDFSVSRPNKTWGIPVPDDPNHKIYVWYDALIYYLTYGIGENCWPATVHVLGKDNQKFHAIYWPAMLKSAGYELPKTILVHDFFTLNGQKISKSLGNVVRPSELVQKYGVDGVRYFFLRNGPLTNDVDITWEKLKETYNADLANGLGNLVARVAKLIEIYKPYCGIDKTNSFSSEVKTWLDEFRFDLALQYIWDKIRGLDHLLEVKRPWEKTGLHEQVLWNELVGGIRQIAFDLQPFLPQTSEKILKQFSGKIISQPSLFQRIS